MCSRMPSHHADREAGFGHIFRAMPSPVSLNAAGAAVLDEEHKDCGCGCGAPALIGTDMEAAQMAMVRRIAERLQVVAKQSDDNGAIADKLLQDAERMIWGLDNFVHGERSQSPMRIGAPHPAFLASWRNRALRVLAKPGRRRSKGFFSRLFDSGKV